MDARTQLVIGNRKTPYHNNRSIKKITCRSHAIFVGALVALWIPTSSVYGQPADSLKDVAAVIANDAVIEAAADFCDTEAPTQGRQLRAAQVQWRQRQDISSVRERAGERASGVDLAALLEKMHGGMRDAGPVKACNQMIALVGSPDMDMRTLHPGAYVGASRSTAASATTASKSATPRAQQQSRASSGRAIQHVVISEKWVMGYGGMMILEYKPVVLYADGNVTYDAARAVSNEARIAGTWRKGGGNKIIVSESGGGKTSELSLSRVGRPARSGQTLSGRYGKFSGLGGGGTGTAAVVAWSNYDFAADGTVRRNAGSGSSSSNVATRSDANDIMRYNLDGYNITFTGADGTPQQMLFYFVGTKDDMIGLGSRTLTKD